MRTYNSMLDAIQDLKRKNFKHNFKLNEANEMECLENGKTYSTDQMRILRFFRFEGQSNPSDMSIVFAVICDDGLKGIITSSYGPYADLKLLSFMDKVKIMEREEAEET